MRFTLDASVHLNTLNPAEEGAAASRELLRRVHQPAVGGPGATAHRVVSPTLLLVEIAPAVARVFDDPVRGRELAAADRDLPGQEWISMDPSFAEKAWAVAADHRLRGADAVYVAVARRAGSSLVTRDRQQLERCPGAVTAVRPEKALQLLGEASD